MKAKLTLTVLVLLLAVGLAGQAANAKATKQEASTAAVICHVFGNYCSQALRVARCESSYSIYAQNGQYLGLFQMGIYARSRYGHGNNAWIQAKAAYRYFVDSGRDWSPWECKPY